MFRFSVHHKSGKLHLDADALSRLWHSDEGIEDVSQEEERVYLATTTLHHTISSIYDTQLRQEARELEAEFGAVQEKDQTLTMDITDEDDDDDMGHYTYLVGRSFEDQDRLYRVEGITRDQGRSVATFRDLRDSKMITEPREHRKSVA